MSAGFVARRMDLLRNPQLFLFDWRGLQVYTVYTLAFSHINP